MSRNDLLNKNWLANSFRNFCKRNDSPEQFVRQSLANITRVARITKSRLRKRKGKKGPRKSRKIKGAKVTRIFLT